MVEQSFKVLKLSADKAKVYRQIDREFGHFALKDLKREVFRVRERRSREVKASTINHTFMYMRTLRSR